nr:TrpB-like pyridoxal phosphate-dependent enzyme [Maliibacterium massiliense]
MQNNIPNKTFLEESELPRHWYNIQADLPMELAPMLNPQTFAPLEAKDLYPILAPGLAQQEFSKERYIEIPEEVMEIYRSYRPSPLVRAYKLEQALGTPAHIYYKYEGNNPSGSHKLNSAIPQAYYNKRAGMTRLTTETGGGQWGTALAVATKHFDMDCVVYMVRVSYEQKPYRRMIMETYGASVVPSPSDTTEAGRAILEKDPQSTGSLGIAITEAVEDAVSSQNTRYSLGSVLNHVAMHQTVIGQEAMLQMEKIGAYPDIVIGCCGGGSNFAGIAFPFMKDKFSGKSSTRFVAVEPSACPTLTRGKFAYDYADTGHVTPISKMYTLGSGFVPAGIHSGGLRYHGESPIVSALYHDGWIEAVSKDQSEVFQAAVTFAQSEIILPAPESAHAISQAIAEALRCKETGEEKTILFCLSGNGYLDLSAYDAYNHDRLVDVPYDEQMLRQGLATLPQVDESKLK